MKTRAFFSWGKVEARKPTKEGKGKMRTNTRKFRLALTSLVLLILSLLLTPAMTWAQTYYWAKSYGGASSDGAFSIQQTTDGGYVVAGWTTSFGAEEGDFWVLKLAGDGNIQWQKTYGGRAPMRPPPFSRRPMAAMWWLATQTPLEPKR